MLQGLPPTTPPMVFADESFREDPTEGVYVLATAALESQAQQPARELMRRLLGWRRTNKLHWHEMDRLQQKMPPTASRASRASTSLPSALRCPVAARNEHAQHA